MESLLLAERSLLYTLAFDLNVDHSYPVLVENLKKLGMDKVDNADDVKLFQLTHNMLNDRCGTRGSRAFSGGGWVAAFQARMGY
eukprot:365277-Chlamydomonas_euryale.AAC.21